MKIIGIGNKLNGEDIESLIKEFGGVFLGERLQDLDKIIGEGDEEVVIVDLSKNVKFIVLGLDDIYPGILSYNELENYLLEIISKGIKVNVTIVAFSKEKEEIGRCFLKCLLLKKSTLPLER
ncbi:hypothetical protein CM19_10830 [Candidatus Acidianus copahuensis]|uniref:Hydrogenase maturation protease n=1 Tax=Candidatus Acidianus copahuensis TaxID=1160895 RepID=A0A031LK98_9CREN|nr:hypothetical protein [Candidatus Acidianus copahuensis]EZQ01971.1 hypothetical protein CM19_10830 [Candidatus Acidianus copahuensis]